MLNIGDKFGKLTVLKEIQPSTNKKTRKYLCQCECGKQTEVSEAQLIAKRGTKSCGCGRGKRSAKDFSHQRFHYLEPIEPTSQRTIDNRVIWKVLCHGCGQYYYYPTDVFQTRQSCGCMQNNQRRLDLTGQTFDFLTVLRPAPNQGQKTCWVCQCVCGKEITITTSNLRGNQQHSCGCIKQSTGELKIQTLLSAANIQFETEKHYEDCRFPDTQMYARYDFYLPQYNCLIEFDGRQHIDNRPWGFFTAEKLRVIREHDQFKNNYAKQHNITLIRIPYTQLNKLTLNDLLPTTSQFILR